MTDRQLLELAAKACGLQEAKQRIEFNQWNPLEDDGDALRLAVRLNIQVTPGTYNKDEFTAFKAAGGEAHEFRSYQQDEFASTRRAITRAAAEIGRAMHEA